MRLRKDAIALAFVLCAGGIFSALPAAPPGLWMYTDEFGQPLYSGVEIVDTSSIGPTFTVPFDLHNDTRLGDDAYDIADTSVMRYFSFDYQFTQGWSGFKMMWEARDWTWDATGFDSLVIKYIGPLQSHKVDILFGETYDRYAPAFLDSIGTLPSNYSSTYKSSAWKTVVIPLPPAPAGADRTQIREVRFLIHNADGTTALTSAVGNLSIDKVGLVWKSSTGIRAVSNGKSVTNNRLFFTPAISGTVTLSIFSLNGKRLADKQVPVMAGKQYSIKQFSSANANLSASQVDIVRISGAGVNVQEKIR